jgi:hypothetical protein
VRRRDGRLTATVNFRGQRKSRAIVRVEARTRDGRIVRERRAYRTCVGR